MPDYFVPLDTTKFTAFHRKLMAKNIIMDTFLKYVDNNRKELKKDYKTFESFKKQYEVPISITNQIIAEAKKEKIEPKDSDELKKLVKAQRAIDWSARAFKVIMLKENKAFGKKGKKHGKHGKKYRSSMTVMGGGSSILRR